MIKLKSKLKKIIFPILLLIIATFIFSNSYEYKQIKAATKEIKMNRKKATIPVGGKVKLSVSTKRKVKWYSSNKSVAIVNAYGKVIGKSVGEAKIRAKVGKRTFTCNVKVDNPMLSRTSVTLNVNDSMYLYVSGTERKVEWHTTNNDIVEVEDGEITGIAVGKAQVVAAIGKLEIICDITVLEDPKSKVVPTAITIDKTSAVLDTKGQTLQLKANIYPSIANSMTELKWTSSNSYVATVDQNGIVTAVADGNATITVTTANNKSNTCYIIVECDEIKSIYLSKYSLTFTNMEQLETLKVTTEPSNSQVDLIWNSSNEKVAVVDKNGVVTPIGDGSATITVKTKNNHSASCLVTVKIKKSTIYLSKTSITFLNYGDCELLIPKITGSSSSTSEEVTWTTSDESVATVNNDGLVKAIGAGTATITAKLENGNSATCKIIVNNNAITISPTSYTISEVGGSYQLEVSGYPLNETITWSSSNEEVVIVDSTGKIKAIGNGETTIKAETRTGDNAECLITVKNQREINKQIPSDAVTFGDHYYYLYSDTKNWYDMKKNCEQLGGHLATITSKEENDFLYNYIKEKGVKNCFFGLSYRSFQKKWGWVTEEPLDYTNWAVGKPSIYNTKDYFGMFDKESFSGEWNNNTEELSYYLCEWDSNYLD